MLRWIFRVLFLAASCILAYWAWQGLFGVDQTHSLSMGGVFNNDIVPIMVGTSWGVLLLFGAGDFVSRGGLMGNTHLSPRMTALGIGTVIEVSRTGVTINGVPQYAIFLKVTPTQGAEFTSRMRTLLDAADAAVATPGAPMPVHYDPHDHEQVVLADITDPAVRQKLLDWRITQGLIAPHLVAARTRGVCAPASVLALRPTGNRKAGQVEIRLNLLITPDGEEPWEAETTVYVYPQALSRVQVGSPVFAMYEPHDRSAVAMIIEKEAA